MCHIYFSFLPLLRFWQTWTSKNGKMHTISGVWFSGPQFKCTADESYCNTYWLWEGTAALKAQWWPHQHVNTQAWQHPLKLNSMLIVLKGISHILAQLKILQSKIMMPNMNWLSVQSSWTSECNVLKLRLHIGTRLNVMQPAMHRGPSIRAGSCFVLLPNRHCPIVRVSLSMPTPVYFQLEQLKWVFPLTVHNSKKDYWADCQHGNRGCCFPGQKSRASHG